MPIFRQSIRSRLTRFLIVGVCSIVLVTEGILFFVLRIYLLQQFDESLVARAFALVSLVEYEDYTLIFEFSTADAISLPYGSMPKYVSIWDDSGQRFWWFPESRKKVLPHLAPGTFSRPKFYDIEAGGHAHIRAVAVSFKPVRVEFEDPLAVVDAEAVLKNAPLLDMVVADDRRYLDIMLRQFIVFLALGNILITGGIAFYMRRAIKKELQPLENISSQVSRLNIDNLNNRFQKDHLPDELQPIAQRLDDFLTRLEEAVNRERRFTSAAAHELRTPLTELRSVLEIAHRWPEDADPEATLAECLQIGGRMEKLVQTLLELTRCQSGARRMEKSSCHIEDLVLGCIEPFRDIAEQRKVLLETSFKGNPEIQTDADLLSAILTNLISNAVHNACTESDIMIHADCNGHSFSVTISNRQNGLRDDDLDHLFEPFWQKDPSRTSRTGLGMGLTLSRAYATLLGGRLRASLDESERISLILTVP